MVVSVYKANELHGYTAVDTGTQPNITITCVSVRNQQFHTCVDHGFHIRKIIMYSTFTHKNTYMYFQNLS